MFPFNKVKFCHLNVIKLVSVCYTGTYFLEINFYCIFENYNFIHM